MRNTFALLFATLATISAAPAAAIECSAEKYGVKLTHKVETTARGTEASCSAGNKSGGSSAPAGFYSHENGLCVAGAWAFTYSPETKTSTATYSGKAPPKRGARVELKCATTSA